MTKGYVLTAGQIEAMEGLAKVHFQNDNARRINKSLGDATGHGIGPALSATQVRAMLRVALRLNASLDDAFVQVQIATIHALKQIVGKVCGSGSRSPEGRPWRPWRPSCGLATALIP